MIRYLLDTNISIEIIRGRSVTVLNRLRQCAVDEVGISAIALAELEHGVEKSSRPDQNRMALNSFSAPLIVLAFDDAAAATYGRIRADLERAGQTIGAMDMLIAAHALAKNVVLVTNNEREFRRVEGLAVENWTVKME